MSVSKKIILLVEDDPVTAISEKVLLEANGYSVLTAATGRKAIDTATGSNVDLILMDLELGGDIDGHGAAARILEKKNIPILFLTAHIEREMVEKVRSVTRYGYALKNSGDYVLLSSIEMVFELFEAHERTRISEENYRKLVEDINDIIFTMDSSGVFTYISPRVESVSGYKADEVIGHNFSDFTPESDKAKAEMLIRSLIEEREYRSEFRRIKKNGEYAWLSTSLRPVIIHGKLTGATGLISDITERKINEERVAALLEEKEGLLKEMNCLYNIARIAEEHPSSVDTLLTEAIIEIPRGFTSPEHIAVRIGCGGKCYTSGFVMPQSESVKKDILVNRTGYGTVQFFYNNRHSFSAREHRFAASITDRLGRIIELIVAKNDLRDLENEIISISECERQQIGREIHDSLGQILTGVSFMLKTLKSSINTGDDTLPDRINEISKLVYDATMICRKITRGLPMQSIGHDNLVLAIDQLAINMRNLYQLNCEFSAEGDLSLGDDFISSQLYYIAQEAVNNAAKHSSAGNVKISITRENGLIKLSVHDDGNGRDSAETEGLGLNIMKYRSDLMGGTFRAENHSEKGFLIEVNVPV
jgi:PAS domain S-box-containing protein